jgi:hypothetical protein
LKKKQKKIKTILSRDINLSLLNFSNIYLRMVLKMKFNSVEKPSEKFKKKKFTCANCKQKYNFWETYRTNRIFKDFFSKDQYLNLCGECYQNYQKELKIKKDGE